jgi:hypothetical protein
MAPIPPIAELVQIALNVHFAKVMEGSCLGVGNSQANAAQLFVRQRYWNMSHLEPVPKPLDNLTIFLSLVAAHQRLNRSIEYAMHVRIVS